MVYWEKEKVGRIKFVRKEREIDVGSCETDKNEEIDSEGQKEIEEIDKDFKNN